MKKEAIKQRIRATEAQVELFASELDSFVRRNIKKLLRRIEEDDLDAKEAARLLGRIMTELEKAGLDKQIAKSRKIYAEELSSVKAELKSLGADVVFSDTDRDTVETLVEGSFFKTKSKFEDYSASIREAAMRSLILGERPSIDALSLRISDRVKAGLQSELNTSIQAFHRTVVLKKAQDVGFKLFEYLGPDDQITREFCERVLDGRAPGVKARPVPIYSIDEIRKMDNGQGLPVMTHCGGYNCRHQWRPISEEDAKAEGYKGK